MDYKKISELAEEEGRFIHLTGIQVLEIRAGYAKGMIEVKKHHTNPIGLVHGGCIYTMADTIAGIAANTHGEIVVTTNSSFSFLASAVDTAVITAEANEVRHGRKLSVYDVKIRNEKEELIATGTFQFYNTGKPIEEK